MWNRYLVANDIQYGKYSLIVVDSREVNPIESLGETQALTCLCRDDMIHIIHLLDYIGDIS